MAFQAKMECPICYEGIEAAGASTTSCGHVFHAACLTSWLERANTCPSCRTVVAPAPTDPHAEPVWMAWFDERQRALAAEGRRADARRPGPPPRVRHLARPVRGRGLEGRGPPRHRDPRRTRPAARRERAEARDERSPPAGRRRRDDPPRIIGGGTSCRRRFPLFLRRNGNRR